MTVVLKVEEGLEGGGGGRGEGDNKGQEEGALVNG